MHEAMLDLVRLWNLKTDLAQGHPFEAHEDIAHTTLDAIWVVTLGSSANTIGNQASILETVSGMTLPSSKDVPVHFPKPPHPPAFDAVLTITESITPLIASPYPKIHHWFLRQSKSYKEAKKYKDQEIESVMKAAIKKFSEDQIDSLEKQGKDRSAVDHMIRRELLASRKEGREPQWVLFNHSNDRKTDITSRYDTPAAKDEIFGFLIAGHETTSTTTAWGVKLLSDNQQAQTKLREVLRSTYVLAADEKRQPTPRELAILHHPYIDAVLEEILRCGSTAAVTSRLAMVDTDVLGVHIPKGTDVNFLAYADYIAPPVGAIEEHKRSSSSQASKDKTGVWRVSDISVFKPERWLQPTGEKGEVEFTKNAGPSLPFGAGIRGCFGMLYYFILSNRSNPLIIYQDANWHTSSFVCL
jgi:hypothetical protein